MRLTEEEFQQRLRATRMAQNGRTARACRIVLVQGKSMTYAAEAEKVTNSVVTRGVKRLQSAVITKNCMCPRCGYEF